jgi:hypothetical protein
MPVDLAQRVARKRTSSVPWRDPMRVELKERRAFRALEGTKAISKEQLAELKTDSAKVDYIMAVIGND